MYRIHAHKVQLIKWSQFVVAHAVSSYSIGAERRMESNKATHGANDNRHSVDSKSNDNDDVDGGTVYVIAFEGKEDSAEKERDTEESGKNMNHVY